MLENLGQRIRLLRKQKGISLNVFAKELGVSSGYLSGLETGKTENIPLKVLEKLQEELAILPMETDDNEISHRFAAIRQHYDKLLEKDPEAANYLLSTFENGVRFFLLGSKEEQ
ncbi:helix-turn-helix domain-containing protein [Bacillus sp. J33]|uniref:helix-turn-helix domain-containing protein n=1 Tax=Bacillus sp. J33 TaxID=935836 RepID=UPI00047EBC83|nr:helix-turn-helix domain-containing protein [Bacillus sp. J33]